MTKRARPLRFVTLSIDPWREPLKIESGSERALSRAGEQTAFSSEFRGPTSDKCHRKLFLVDQKLFSVYGKLFLVDRKLFSMDRKLFSVDGKLFPADGKLRPVDRNLHPVDGKLLHVEGKVRPVDENFAPIAPAPRQIGSRGKN
jgi:hypothetical protein